ncbi:MAG: Bifunctional protein HldE [Candidatus Omnitrophica bacterium]|nr:Bifunctional protein HldE [Candidatus Omnitrophota bacterium]
MNPSSKIKTLEELKGVVAALRKRKKSLVQCHGVFDLIHPGHVRHFAMAKKEGDVLIVTITSDRHVRKGPGRPYFNERLRAEQLAALQDVDYVAVLDHPTAVEGILAIRPDVYAKGQDYRDASRDVTGMIGEEESAVRSCSGRLHFTDEITFSSSGLINTAFEVYPPETVKYLKLLARRHSIEEVRARLSELSKLKVLVIGDAIIDQYHYCRAMDRSSKESLVVHRYLSDESFAGGALAVANHVAELCGQVDLVSVLGSADPYESFIRSKLGPRVRPRFFRRHGCPTTIKRRFVSDDSSKKVFEICYMDDTPISGAEEEVVRRFLDRQAGRYDLVIVADYGHGLMTPAVIRTLSRRARYLTLNVQTNSANLGFNLVTKYPKADFVCIDEKELRLATHDKHGPIQSLVKRVQSQLRPKAMVVTRGVAGSIAYAPGTGFQDAPALSFQVVDKVGAGDAFYSFAAPCVRAGFSADLVSFIGNAAGSIAVQIVCNRQPVKQVDLIKFMTRLLKI